MIESLLRSEAEGEVSFDYPEEGFRFTCRCAYFPPDAPSQTPGQTAGQTPS